MAPPAASTERLDKSVDRVRELAEVFTPSHIVQEVLDRLPAEMWAADPSPTFLEPACGDGNFLVAVLDRKLAGVAEAWQAGGLRAGDDATAHSFHALEALSSLYGMDISPDNLLGGVPDHALGARRRLERIFTAHIEAATGATHIDVVASARWILEHNIQIANLLPGAPRMPGAHDGVQLISYEWHPQDRVVSLSRTTLGDLVIGDEEEALTLFSGPELASLWSGPPEEMHQIGSAEVGLPRSVPVRPAGPA